MIEWLNEPRVMGILNATPDSFHASSRVNTIDEALAQARIMVKEGADMLDIGGQSTRPGATEVSEEEELKRVLPVIQALRVEFPALLLSIDTFYASVAERSVQQGVHLINDISNGRFDKRIQQVALDAQIPYVLMHSRGDSKTMSQLTQYENVVDEVFSFFESELERLTRMGMKQIIIDLGFGFAKTSEQNFALMEQLDEFNTLGFPQLVGVSRKKMIQHLLEVSADDSLNGTTVLNTLALTKGAKILRVHDVKEAVEAVKLVSQFTFSGQ